MLTTAASQVAVNYLPASALWWTIHLFLAVGSAVAAAWGIAVLVNPPSNLEDATRWTAAAAALVGPFVSAGTIGKLVRHTDSEKLVVVLLVVASLAAVFCAYQAGSDQVLRPLGLAAAAVIGWGTGWSAASELVTRLAATIPMSVGGFLGICLVAAIYGVAKALR